MRSQTTKSLPKKGVNKATFKANSPNKQQKRKNTTPKKIKKVLNKSPSKTTKKIVSKDDLIINKKHEDCATEKNQSTSENFKAGTSKSSQPRSYSPAKKNKGEAKEKNEISRTTELLTKKNVGNKIQCTKTDKNTKSSAKKKANVDDIKYKLNTDKKANTKFSKAKNILKKSVILTQKKKSAKKIKEISKTENETTNIIEDERGKTDGIRNNDLDSPSNTIEQSKINETTENKSNNTNDVLNSPHSSISLQTTLSSDSIKSENERPPKFFTSTRSPRMVDIDVKCCKTGKGVLSVSERFVSMKCESKNEFENKDKNNSNTLISQGPEIDVYTFTDKVDSPKSILSDFHSPTNKNIGRVRPIARVKGTVIDKNKIDTERKKFSPHRPIEEVVKQLKANKKSEDLKRNENIMENPTSSTIVEPKVIKSDEEDKPKPIISKSYKMVARKTSIPGKPFSPIKFLEQDTLQNSKSNKISKNINTVKQCVTKIKKKKQKVQISDEEIDTSKFSLNTKSKVNYSSSEESVSESNDDNDAKESSEYDTPKNKNKSKNKKYKKITDSTKKSCSKELQELSRDSLEDLKDESVLIAQDKPSKRRLKLLSMWTGPKKHRMASLNAIAKVHCLYENESRTHMELGLMRTVDRQVLTTSTKPSSIKKRDSKTKESDKRQSTSDSDYEQKEKSSLESSEDDTPLPTRPLRVVPGIRSAGMYWDPKSSTSSSDDSELDSRKKIIEKKKTPTKASSIKTDNEKIPKKLKKTSGMPIKKKRNRNEVVMDLKDMVVQKRMASLNATAILAASYEKRSPKSSRDDSTSDSCSDESFIQKPKNGVSSGVKSETKQEEPKKEIEDGSVEDRKQKVEVIVNQDTDVTITGVYSTHHHEGFCTVSGMQYRISSTSHTQTTATANCEKVRLLFF